MHSTNSALILGYQLNLIKGIKAEWNTLSGTGSPFFPPDYPYQLKMQDLPPYDPKTASFDIFELSFHYSWKELIDAIFSQWRIADEELQNNTSPFVLVQPSGEEIKSNLCKKLGIHQEDASNDGETGFALVKVSKSVIKCAYKFGENNLMSDELRIAIASLPEDFRDIAPFLDFFNKYGTHFVSEIELGDTMYQVFIYDKVTLKKIETRFNKNYITGRDVWRFQQFTEPRSQYAGFSKYAGALNLASNDPLLDGMLSEFKDDVNFIGCSIFIANGNEKGHLLSQLNCIIPIGCNLMNFSSFVAKDNSKEIWTNIFRNSLYQKYRTNINPKFPQFKSPYNYAEIYKTFKPQFASTISTASIYINQIHLDLKDVVTLNPENVKTLFILADVIEISSDVPLPGSDVTITCRKFISHTTDMVAPIILLADGGYNSLNFYCREFDGEVEIKNAKNGDHKLISHGQALQTVTAEDKQTTVVFDKSHMIYPPIALLRLAGDRTLYTLGLPLQSAQCIMNYPASRDALTVASLFVKWLSDILESATENDIDLLTIRSQALLLLKSNKNLPDGILNVPYLTYEAYKPAIDAMIDAVEAFECELRNTSQQIQVRKSEERISKDQEELNRNIQSVGRFLNEQNKALAEKEKDVASFHDKVDAKQQSMLNDAQKKVNDLKTKLDEQQKVMHTAEDELKNAVKAYVAEQELQALIQLAGAVGSLFAGGAGLASLSKDMERIKRIMTIIDAVMKLIDSISKLYASIDGTVQTAIAASNVLSKLPEELNFPTALDWTEFDAEVFAIIGPITAKVPYANTYLKETKILSSRGRAFIEAASQVTRLQYDIMLNGWQKEVSQRQYERLEKINDTLSQSEFKTLDAEKIDLFELGSIYQSHAERVIIKLIKTLSLQDAALQYYYLQPPSPIESYDLLSLKEMIVSQAEKSITSLESFPSKPTDLGTPLKWILKDIKVDQLIDDSKHPSDSPIDKDNYMKYSKGGHYFEIPLNLESIFNYLRVRINEIEMEIQGVKSTYSGKVNLRLTTAAHPFYDRGLKRENIAFNTVSQDFEYVYDLDTGKCEYTNKPSGEFAQFFMKMTPFTRWRISLPMGEHSENQGIKFSGDTIDITLRIHLQAIRMSANELRAMNIC